MTSAFFVAGAVVFLLNALPVREVPSSPGEEILVGKVQSFPRQSSSGSSWTFELETFSGREYLVRSRKEFLPRPGETVRLQGRTAPLRGNLDPGVRDWTTTLRNRGIAGYFRANRGVPLKRADDFIGRLHAMRLMLSQRIDNTFSPPSAALMKALLLGFRQMDRTTTDQFSRAGVAHLFAVSGTHLGMLVLAVMFAIRNLLLYVLPQEWYLRLSLVLTATQVAALVAIPVVIGYTLISGAQVPTVRAMIMILSVLGALLAVRRHQWANALGLAALVVLLWDPRALFGASFQLTFAAVAVIGVFVSKMAVPADVESSMPQAAVTGKRRRRTLMVWGFLPVVALAGTGPILVHHFGATSLVSPIANLMITPLVGFVLVPLGFMTIAVGPTLAVPAELIARSVFSMVSWFASIPYGVWRFSAPTPAWLVAYFALLLLPLRVPWKIGLAAILVGAAVIPGPVFAKRGELAVVFLDVGQGAATLVTFPDGRTMLVDTGGARGVDIGATVVVPALRALGVRSLDCLVLTHRHPDHMGGAGAVLQTFKVEELWVSRSPHGAGSVGPWDPSQQLRVVARGTALEGDGYRVDVLSPSSPQSPQTPAGQYSDENNESIVLRISSPYGVVLLPGDIEAETEQELAGLPELLKADVFQVPHHGSRSSSTPGFLRMVRPRVAVTSAGSGNSFGHPHGEVMERLARAGVEVFRTDRDGAVAVIVGPGGIRVKRWIDAGLTSTGALRGQWWNLLRLMLGPSFQLTPDQPSAPG